MQPVHPTVILGGGFVGLFTALSLSHQHYGRPIVLIDQRDRFVFKPLLYELLTGELHGDQVCPSYVDLLSQTAVSFVQDTVESVDLSQRQITLQSGKHYRYEHLVVALGSCPSYFNTPGAEQYALPFTTAQQALTLRYQLKARLRQALSTVDLARRRQLLTVAVIGAGPAGVELACTLADILPVWYDAMGGNYEELRVVLINRSNEILNGDINSQLRQQARRSLQNRTIAVELILEAAVKTLSDDGIHYIQYGQPKQLPTRTIAWTAGTEPHPLLKTLALESHSRDARGRLRVLPTLQLLEQPSVFVGGDAAYVSDRPQPPTAQVAYQHGKAIAANIMAIAAGRDPQPAQVSLRGTLMKLGIGEGIANLFDRFTVHGEVGHLIREATYLELLPTPLHNLKATAEWLADGLLLRHQPRSIHPDHVNRTPVLAGATAIFVSVAISVPLIWRAAQPDFFQEMMAHTGIPALLDQLSPTRSPE
ncbi:MAG TPA: NAD(P)/FAD-dependent oxidoreductase [Chroococcidiopsis sp.]